MKVKIVKMKSKIFAVSILSIIIISAFGALAVQAAPPGPTIVDVAIYVNR
jgi:uncharacterized membrane protein